MQQVNVQKSRKICMKMLCDCRGSQTQKNPLHQSRDSEYGRVNKAIFNVIPNILNHKLYAKIDVQ